MKLKGYEFTDAEFAVSRTYFAGLSRDEFGRSGNMLLPFGDDTKKFSCQSRELNPGCGL